uniref:probable serine/threonine-protein kinase PBL28 n=1 Tax=Erigeron canadensis TaxID=72917 RepID=UPI001CB8D900|nr:probable serine/threonine-protein kinase PBL28 [Erigeron canadensis]
MASYTFKELDRLRMPLEEIVKVTNNFADENIIGKGGLGNVYKGWLMRDGEWQSVSARRFDSTDGRRGGENIEFLTEITTLSSLLKHENDHFVPVVGFCEEGGEKIIVSRYQANGSLMMHLSDPASFTWFKRVESSVQVAKAICYLHSGTSDSRHKDTMRRFENGITVESFNAYLAIKPSRLDTLTILISHPIVTDPNLTQPDPDPS